MDAMSMMRVAVILLAIAAVGGVVMTIQRFSSNANPPAWLAMVHGFLAAAAVTLLAYAAFTVGLPTLGNAALALLVLAALGGAVLNLGYQWKNRLLPASIVGGHAVMAVAGFGCLLLAAYGT